MKKIIAVFLLGGLLSSCGSDDSNTASSDGGSESGNETPIVALVMKSLANEFFVNMAAGAEAHNAENSQDYELIVNGIRNESDLAHSK